MNTEHFYYKQDLMAIGDFFLFTIILNTNATMMYNADLGGYKFRQIEAN